MLNKFTVLLAVASFGGALLTLPERRVLASRWVVVGGLVAMALWAPNLWWQASNGWPVLDLSAGIAEEAFENRIMAVPSQMLFLGPLLAAGVAAGWWRQLRGRALRDTRFISVGFVLLGLGGRGSRALGNPEARARRLRAGKNDGWYR